MRIATLTAPLAIGWLAAVTVALVVTVAVSTSSTPLDRELDWMLDVQAWAFPGQTLSDALRALTTTEICVLLGTLLAVGLFVTGHRREALVLLVLIFALPFVQAGIKNLIDRPRPTHELVDIRADFGSESFPAGHVMSPTVLYGFVIWLCATYRSQWPRWVCAGAIVLSAAVLSLTGVVNVWLGVHWPTDVIGGYAWGAVMVLPAIWLTSEPGPEP
jgi:undecaprenyl-diphosphatase